MHEAGKDDAVIGQTALNTGLRRQGRGHVDEDTGMRIKLRRRQGKRADSRGHKVDGAIRRLAIEPLN